MDESGVQSLPGLSVTESSTDQLKTDESSQESPNPHQGTRCRVQTHKNHQITLNFRCTQGFKSNGPESATSHFEKLVSLNTNTKDTENTTKLPIKNHSSIPGFSLEPYPFSRPIILHNIHENERSNPVSKQNHSITHFQNKLTIHYLHQNIKPSRSSRFSVCQGIVQNAPRL